MSESIQDNTPDNKVVPKPAKDDSLFSDDFFAQIDRDLEPNLKEQAPQVLNLPEDDPIFKDHSDDGNSGNNTPESTKTDLDRRLELLEERYKKSSEEGIRLNKEVESFKPFLPMVKAMQKDLANNQGIKDNLASGKIDSKVIKRNLGLPEDFLYDAEEAMNDLTSDSAKYAQAINAHIVKGEIAGALRQRDNADEQKKIIEIKDAEEKAFMKAHPEVDMNELNNYAEGRQLTLEDIHTLMTIDERMKKVASNAGKEVFTKMKDTQSSPRSLANAASQSHKVDPINKIMDIFKNLDKAENMLNG